MDNGKKVLILLGIYMTMNIAREAIYHPNDITNFTIVEVIGWTIILSFATFIILQKKNE